MTSARRFGESASFALLLHTIQRANCEGRYSETLVTDDELSKLHVRNQEAIKRYAATGGAAGSGWSAYYSAQPTPAPQRLRRAGTWHGATG